MTPIAPAPMRLRKINTRDFHLATRSTAREVNRQIVLNLIREHQPISRAELARRMQVRRSALTAIVRELVAGGAVYEVGATEVVRGRRPTLLSVRTRGRLAVAVDVRPGRTSIALAEIDGRIIARDAFDTPLDPEAFAAELARHVPALLHAHGADGDGPAACHGLGLVVPGMVDHRSGRVLYAPRLGWREVDLRSAVASRLALPVQVESAPIACALSRLWLSPDDTRSVHSFAYVSVSEGVGVGLVINGETLRGETHTAVEFGHVTLDPAGPACVCGKHGCWEAFAGNAATVARYLDAVDAGAAPVTIDEVVRRARRGERAAVDAVIETGEQIGRGLAAVVSAFNPGRIYLGGEITALWDLIEKSVRDALVRGTITEPARRTPIVADRDPSMYRLSGAVALVAAPAYAAPSVG